MEDIQMYYEENLKGKTQDQIMIEIEQLKKEMDDLKYFCERNQGNRSIDMPEIINKIKKTRECLKLAKQAYVDAGGVYILSEMTDEERRYIITPFGEKNDFVYCPSKDEKKALYFDDNIEHISSIEYTTKSILSNRNTGCGVNLTNGLEAYRIVDRYELIDDEFKTSKVKEDFILYNDKDNTPYTKEEFLKELKELYIGEWLTYYTPGMFNFIVCDGSSWGLRIGFNNNQNYIAFHGDNFWPYNFDDFLKLINKNHSKPQIVVNNKLLR